MPRHLIQYVQLLLVGIGLVTAQLLLKQGMRLGGPIPMNATGFVTVVRAILSSPFLIAGYAVGGATTLAWLILLSRIDLSYAAPMVTAIYFVLLMLISRFVLHEHIDVGRWGGAVLAIAGIILMSFKR
jgi:drug/metabolite transporter (DMT)-like permease